MGREIAAGRIHAAVVATSTGGCLVTGQANTTIPAYLVHSDERDIENAVRRAKELQPSRKVAYFKLGFRPSEDDESGFFQPLVEPDNPLHRALNHGAGKDVDVGRRLFTLSARFLDRDIDEWLAWLSERGARNLVIFVDMLGGGTGTSCAVELPQMLMRKGLEVIAFYGVPLTVDRDDYARALRALREIEEATPRIPSVLINYNWFRRKLEAGGREVYRDQINRQVVEYLSSVLEAFFNLFRESIEASRPADLHDIVRPCTDGWGTVGALFIPRRQRLDSEAGLKRLLDDSLLAGVDRRYVKRVKPPVFTALDGPFTIDEEEMVYASVQKYWRADPMIRYVTGDTTLPRKVVVQIAGGFPLERFKNLPLDGAW